MHRGSRFRIAGTQTCGSSASHLLIEPDGRGDAAVQPDAVTHVSVDNHRPALDHADRKPAPNLSFDGVGLQDVEHQHLARHGRLPADANPLVVAALLHDNIGERRECANGWFRKSESLVAASISHGYTGSNGRTEIAAVRWSDAVSGNFQMKSHRIDRPAAGSSILVWPRSVDSSGSRQIIHGAQTWSRSPASVDGEAHRESVNYLRQLGSVPCCKRFRCSTPR